MFSEVTSTPPRYGRSTLIHTPAGHVLHYKPGDSKRMSNNMVQHTYTVIRGGDIYSELPFIQQRHEERPQRQYCHALTITAAWVSRRGRRVS